MLAVKCGARRKVKEIDTLPRQNTYTDGIEVVFKKVQATPRPVDPSNGGGCRGRGRRVDVRR
jgi:hypothetical protein